MENPNITSSDFVGYFKLQKQEKLGLVLFSDPQSIGFSIKKKYPENILFKPAKRNNGEDDSIAIIWVGYKYQQEENGLIPIYLRVGMVSLYLLDGNHFDYNFDDPDSPTKESLEISKKSISPAELESYDDYFYDLNKRCFIEKGKKIEARKMLDDIFALHIKTAHKTFGIPFRSKVKIKNIIVNISQYLIIFFKRILKIFFGRGLERKGDRNFLPSLDWEKYRKEDLLPTALNKISILGFEINITKQSFLTSCGLLVLLGILDVHFGFNNDIYAGACVILSIYIIDGRIPYIFFWLINGLITIKRKRMFKKIKIK